MQMPCGKDALSLHGKVTEMRPSCPNWLLLAWPARQDGAGGLEMAVSGRAAPSHLWQDKAGTQVLGSVGADPSQPR